MPFFSRPARLRKGRLGLGAAHVSDKPCDLYPLISCCVFARRTSAEPWAALHGADVDYVIGVAWVSRIPAALAWRGCDVVPVAGDRALVVLRTVGNETSSPPRPTVLVWLP